MEAIVLEYHSDVANVVNRREVLKQLGDIKAKIKIEKRAIERARDIINSVYYGDIRS